MALKVTIVAYSGLVAAPTLAVPKQHPGDATKAQGEKIPALRLVRGDA